MKLGFFVSMMSVGLAAFADPSITEVTAVQRYPWNGKVDVSYKASGIASAAKENGWLTSLKVTATDKQSGTTYTATSLTGDTSVSDGTHAAVWDMSAQGLTFKSTNVVFDVTCAVDYGGVQLWEDGPYWAECNVGATKPEEYGYYFWWGDTVGYKRNADNNGWVSVKDGTSYSFSGCDSTYGMNNSQLQSAGYIDSTGKLVAAHDAATAHLGAPWRMPTDAEFSALINNCDTTWTTRGGASGRLVTGRGTYASKSIFLPAAGNGNGSGNDHTGSWGYCWSSTLFMLYDDSVSAWRPHFTSSVFDLANDSRYLGLPVRPLRGSADSADIKGSSQAVSIDLIVGTRRTSAATEKIAYSPMWNSSSADATAVVCVEGEVVTRGSEAGVYEWTPMSNGTYTLTHNVKVAGSSVGETLSATFVVTTFSPKTPVISPDSGTTFDTTLTVSMSCASDGATIHYTTNGTTPTMESPAYSKKFRVYEKTTVKANAFYEDGTPSEMAVAEYALGQCADPVISLADGAVFTHSNQEVSISGGADGTLRYTLDGSEPTVESPVYEGPFTISETTTVKAKVFSDSFFDSQVVTLILTREWETVATPVITAGAAFTGSREIVTLTCETAGAAIYYTLDGAEPTKDSPLYRGAFNVKECCTIKAIAVLDDYLDSAVAIASVARLRGICDALGVPDVTFTCSGALGWTEDAETAGASGGTTMRSGMITHSQESVLEATVTGKGTLSFFVKTSCEDSGGYYDWDRLEFTADGEMQPFDGECGWTNVVLTFATEGPHTLTWSYIKDDAESEGSDCAWISNMSWVRSDLDPLPAVGSDGTPAEVDNALEGSADTRLKSQIVTGNDYVQFRSWVNRAVGTDFASHKMVKDSHQAWLSYALDSDKLLTKTPEQGEMKIVAFEKNATTGKFDFTVKIEGVNAGTGATEENLAKVFGLEGATEVDGDYSVDNVVFTFGMPVDGKVVISALPADETARLFFMKVKVLP